MSGRGGWDQKGFWSKVFYGLKEQPTEEGDLVGYFECNANHTVDFLRPTEDEAWADAERDLDRQHRIATMHMDSVPFLSKNPKYMPEAIAEIKRQAEENLRIAEIGLEFCEARKK